MVVLVVMLMSVMSVVLEGVIIVRVNVWQMLWWYGTEGEKLLEETPKWRSHYC